MKTVEAQSGWEAHHTHNVVAIIVLTIFVYAIYFLLTHPFWGVRIKNAFKGWTAKTGIILTASFFMIAWFDAVSWKDNVSADHKAGLQAREPRSILDRVFSTMVGVKEYEYKERTYSAPLAKHDFYEKDQELKHKHLLGTVVSGQDTLYLILKGIRSAVTLGVVPLLITIPLAIFFGVLAGYRGGLFDEIVVYIYTVLSSIPSLLLLIVMISTMGKTMMSMCIALGVTSWVVLCRLVRAETFKLRELEYIQAAKCLGVPTKKIILRHVLPNLTHIILITGVLTFTALVLSESILAYLGLGLSWSWGTIIASAKSEIAQDPIVWWNLVFTPSFLFMLVLSVNLVGDALRDALDPRSQMD